MFLVVKAIVICVFSSMSVYAQEYVKVYAPDGRVDVISKDAVEDWKNVGWYDYPVIKVYALDGRSEIISKSSYDSWHKVGWYSYPVQKMYAPDGRVEIISKDAVEDWKDVGWYDYPVTYVYALDGRKAVITPDAVDDWVAVGWYDSLEEVYYLTVKELHEIYMSEKDYSTDLQNLNDAVKVLEGTEFEAAADSLRTETMGAWRSYIRCPIAVESSHAYEEYSVQHAKILFTNISHKKIVAFKVKFDLYNIFGEREKSYYETFIADNANMNPHTSWWFTWELFGADSVNRIKNIRVTEIVYSDGTKWYR